MEIVALVHARPGRLASAGKPVWRDRNTSLWATQQRGRKCPPNFLDVYDVQQLRMCYAHSFYNYIEKSVGFPMNYKALRARLRCGGVGRYR